MADQTEIAQQPHAVPKPQAPIEPDAYLEPVLPHDFHDPRPFRADSLPKKLIIAAATILLVLGSFFPASGLFSNPATWSHQIQTLDNQSMTVVGCTAAAAGASTAISVLPGDIGSPIAEKLADLAADFSIVLAAIFLEKYLLTITGLAAFRILVPLGLLVLMASELMRPSPTTTPGLHTLAAKLITFGIVIVLVVPTSVFLSDLIQTTYQNDMVYRAQAEAARIDASATDTTDATSATSTDANAADEKNTKPDSKDSSSSGIPILDTIGSWGSSLADTVTDAVEDAGDAITQEAQEAVSQATSQFNNLLELFAVMLVSTLAIPVLTIAVFLVLANMVLGTNITVPTWQMRPRGASFAKKVHGAANDVRRR